MFLPIRPLVLLTLCLTTSTSFALTLKTGEVLGSDGVVYNGASPEQLDRLIGHSQASGKTVGVFGQNVFVVLDEGAVFVPFSEVAGKRKETVQAVVVASVVAKVVEEATEIELEVDDLAKEIEAADGDLEIAVSALVETLSSRDKLSLQGLNDTLFASSQDQQAVTEQFVSELTEKNVNIEAAVNSWASLSAAEKQSVVDRVNSSGALGCSSCTIADAQQFIDDITQNEVVVNLSGIGDGQDVLATLSEPETAASLQRVSEDVVQQTTESLSDKIERIIGAAVAATQRTGADINTALSDWDAMPDIEKQALVDRLNQGGILGCTDCTIQDAEERADSLRQ